MVLKSTYFKLRNVNIHLDKPAFHYEFVFYNTR
jgi:hypothetical protein